ncbi:MAG: flagellar basal body L-ring protein FlgH [Bdellovibrionales bacterium]|nr:flagellar basal body L-ring protein FlgH [Bdellovibrionales bacterium]
MKFLRNLILVLLLFSNAGCGTFGKKLKAWLGGESYEEVEKDKKARVPASSRGTKYSQSSDLHYDVGKRKYERMTKEKFEDTAKLEETRGSLWRMEGQGSYLFSENNIRLEGDVINVKLEGHPRNQLQTKVDVIKTLLNRLKEAKARRAVASASSKSESKDDANKADEDKESQAKKDDKKDDTNPFEVDLVPVRIVEKLANGNYRVRGGQTFMIDRREYKVIVTGEVRPKDVDEGIVSAPKMLDSDFDIVSPRREVQL